MTLDGLFSEVLAAGDGREVFEETPVPSPNRAASLVGDEVDDIDVETVARRTDDVACSTGETAVGVPLSDVHVIVVLVEQRLADW